jgi:uncharacterized BrkB/YihY/UPF0761 family membrane protein
VTAEPASPDLPDAEEPPPSGIKALAERGREQLTASQARIDALLERHKHHPVVDVGLRIYQRDREAAGTLVGSAIAFRLFLFFIPLLLFAVGVLGFLAELIGNDDIEATGIAGTLAEQIDTALTQPNSTRWIATLAGLIGMALAGRTLTRVLVAASCLAWRLPVRVKASPRLIGAIIGLVFCIGLVATLVNRVRAELGLAVAGFSFLVAFAIYLAAWVLLSMLLPRATRDPGALLPGAVLMALVLAGLQAVSQLYLPDRFDRASQLYGAIGTTLVTLGWFFIIGRSMMLSLSINAVIYERFGSISQFVFSLPLLRALPRRWEWFRRFFQLPE